MTRQLSPFILIDPSRNTIHAYLSYHIFQEHKWYFAECPELSLIDQGKSQREAIENLMDMVKASLIEAIETGNVDEMLKALGFSRRKVNLTMKYRTANSPRYYQLQYIQVL